MDYAVEVRSGAHVYARDASPYRSYICPVCRGEVFVRRGVIRRTHYAHKHETARPECKFYTSGPDANFLTTKLHSQNRFSSDQHFQKIEPPGLSLEVESRRAGGSHSNSRWGLRLPLPRSPQDNGQIQYDLGELKPRRIPLSKLHLSPLTYPVGVDKSEFRATWCSPEVSPEYRDVLSEHVPGLNR